MKNKKMKIMVSLVVILAIISITLGVQSYNKTKEVELSYENQYNQALYGLVDYVQNVETYLAKSLISTTPEHGAETLTHVWREANLAEGYLAMLPMNSNELANTSKFLNQVSEYSYALSRKNINNESLSQEDLDNLGKLHDYSVEMENTLNQLVTDMNDGRISWKELTNTSDKVMAQQVSNMSQDSFSSLEENFHEYAGLIYDGAFSEHITNAEKKGLTGEEIDEGRAEKVATDFVGSDRIKEISSSGESENSEINSYDFNIKVNDADDKNTMTVSVSKKGGHIVFMNYNREVNVENLSNEQANEIAKNFLTQKGFNDMEATYYMKESGIVTINYAYNQKTEYGDVIVYSDLIKVKVALDNGEIMGIETSGYLNSHYDRNISNIQITKESAKENLNKNIEVQTEKLAIIPTEWKTEVLCWEFKGKVGDTQFLVYINAETGKEEDILILLETPGGTLTM